MNFLDIKLSCFLITVYIKLSNYFIKVFFKICYFTKKKQFYMFILKNNTKLAVRKKRT